jgi:hypothetical protein
LRDHLFQVRIGRGDNPHIHFDRTLFTERLNLALLQKSKKLWLNVERQIANFIEK